MEPKGSLAKRFGECCRYWNTVSLGATPRKLLSACSKTAQSLKTSTMIGSAAFPYTNSVGMLRNSQGNPSGKSCTEMGCWTSVTLHGSTRKVARTGKELEKGRLRASKSFLQRLQTHAVVQCLDSHARGTQIGWKGSFSSIKAAGSVEAERMASPAGL